LDVFSKGFAPKNGKICMTINTFSQGGFDWYNNISYIKMSVNTHIYMIYCFC
jgi:hypothetical protein